MRSSQRGGRGWLSTADVSRSGLRVCVFTSHSRNQIRNAACCTPFYLGQHDEQKAGVCRLPADKCHGVTCTRDMFCVMEIKQIFLPHMLKSPKGLWDNLKHKQEISRERRGMFVYTQTRGRFPQNKLSFNPWLFLYSTYSDWRGLEIRCCR